MKEKRAGDRYMERQKQRQERENHKEKRHTAKRTTQRNNQTTKKLYLWVQSGKQPDRESIGLFKQIE